MQIAKTETRFFRAWSCARPPSRILVIRFQAVGDVVITLPACTALRRRFPDARIDMLTGTISMEILQSTLIFDHVYSEGPAASRLERIVRTFRRGMRLRKVHYDVILDLQRHRGSRTIRMLAAPRSWGEFDRFSSRHALDRTLDTCHRTGFAGLRPVYGVGLKPELQRRTRQLLQEHGWASNSKLVVMNPAGLYVTRNWPLDSYRELAELWSEREDVQFLFVGTSRIARKAEQLARQLGRRCINLTNQTGLAEAFGVIQHSSAVISEDSGLMHMAWVSGIPTVALFGSTRSDWTRPLGKHSRYFSSEDLPCGACMQPACRFGDVHCLSRRTAEQVFNLACEAMRGRERDAISPNHQGADV